MSSRLQIITRLYEEVAAIRDILASSEGQLSTWSRVDPQGERIRYTQAVLGEDWERLERSGRDEASARSNNRTDMTSRLSSLRDAAARLETAAQLAHVVRSGATEWPAARLTELRRRRRAEGRSRTEIRREIDQLRSPDLKRAVDGLEDSLDGRLSRLGGLATHHAQATMGAVIAAGVARLNTADAEAVDAPAPRRRAREAIRELTRLERDIHRALARERTAAAAALAEQVAAEAQEHLLWSLIPAAATLSADTWDRPVAELRAAILCGDAIRACLRAIALGIQLPMVLAAPAGNREQLAWLRAASDLPFSVPEPDVDKTRIKDLAQDPAASDRNLIAVEGTIGTVTVEHRGRKVVSHCELIDGAGHYVIAVLPYIKLDSGGMVEGAAARLIGRWRADSNEVAGPALHLDRISYTQLARESFEHWVTKELRAVYEARPHGLNASWSWQRGIEGPANQLRFGTWYDE